MNSLFFFYSKEEHYDEYNLKNILDMASKIAIKNENDMIEKKVAKKFCCSVITKQENKYSGIINFDERQNSIFSIIGLYHTDLDAPKFSIPKDVIETIKKAKKNDRSLYGIYTYVFYDEEKDSVIVEGDMFGIYPIYYIRLDDGIAVASEIKMLLHLSRKEINYEAVMEYLRFGYLVTENTLIKDVKRLLPGQKIIINRGKFKIQKLNFPEFIRDGNINDGVLNELDRAFQLHLQRYKTVYPDMCVSLSGGLDSRLAMFEGKRAGIKLSAISMGQYKSLEANVAKSVCSLISIPHEKYQYDGSLMPNWYDKFLWITEGRCPPGHMHFIEGMLCKGNKMPAIIHGLIGDAVVGGDLDNEEMILVNKREKMLQGFRNGMGSFLYWPKGSLELLLDDIHLKMFSKQEEKILSNLASRINTGRNYSDYLWLKMHFRVFGFTIPCLCSQINPWADIVAPYLDRKIFDICAMLNYNSIKDRKTQVDWALKYCPGIDNIPRIKDGITIKFSNITNEYDIKLSWLKKKFMLRYYLRRMTRGRIDLRSVISYPDYGQWYRKNKNVREYVNNILLSEKTISRGMWNESGIKLLIKYLSIGKNVWEVIGTILLIEKFIREFIENDVGSNFSIL